MVKKFGYLMISFLVFIVLINIGQWFIKPANDSDIVVLDEGWTVYYNNTEYEDVKLSEFRKLVGKGTSKGDNIIFIHDDVSLKYYTVPTFMFESRFSAWNLYQDETHIDDDFLDAYKEGKFIGCNYNFITLHRSYKDVRLMLAVFVNEDGAYNYYEAPVIGDYLDVLFYEIYRHSFFFLIAAFLIVFGLIFFAIAVAFRSDMPEINMQMYSALLFLVLGTWFMAQFELFDLFVDTNGHQTEIEYISLYMVVPLMYMVMGCMRNYLKKKIFWAFSFVGAMIPLVLIALHFFGVVYINRLLFVYQLDAVVLIVFMFVMILMIDLRSEKLPGTQLIQVIGQALLALAFVFNMLFFYLEVIGVSEQIMLSKKVVPLGAMCMVFGTMVNYYLFISESFSRKSEFASLAHLAYEDELTRIANRSKYEKYMENLWAKGEDFLVVSIDLNGLKTVNDNQGHLMGDKYLVEFGTVLEDCFGNEGFIARIGGDEFVAILTGDNMSKVDELIEKMNRSLDKLNAEDATLYRSAAVGYAYRHEAPDKEYHSVYLLADERMYENKKLTHGARR
ncbi:diguanylate cyclase (GGDEF) domain-containing protein [Pseudobutyrivibrio sp. OR37]|uniref:GGDEF domain-containing protein n=1 Tax=Pseudobutyrivibrio sp. OR37 TaxID=1798186 RepID=UPI0008E1461F|nr:GGDEF domain-containing protein [Pseudobutyrivibrio sp. OR37]SFH58655.1 diguanylate cyclase (GGDEF) domain-containing protein [Pseudobutyrivibrio sp. OR37]